MVLYNLFLYCYPKIAKLVGFFNPKAKEWINGQNAVWDEIKEKRKSITGKVIWIHAASYGEFEQGLPIIEALKKEYSSYQIWLTFFSPSGYLHRNNDSSVDVVTYLPLDGKQNAKSFIEIVNPKLIVFIKYEFWYYYLNEAKSNNIPTVLASAIFRPNQIFFKWYGKFYKKMLQLFSQVLVQDKDAYDLAARIVKHDQLKITGDTRFDRVVQTAKSMHSIPWLNLLSTHNKIIAGSTWNEDHIVLSKATAHFTDLNWIIVPHLVDEKSINGCKSYFTNAITLSELIAQNEVQSKPIVLIVDRIGLLRTLYQYAFVTYVGGGFGSDGVHNVLEPAAFAKPVLWGNNDSKYKEAIGLRNANGGFTIKNEAGLVMYLNEMIQSKLHYEQTCKRAYTYIQDHAGATSKTMTQIAQYLD